MPAVTQPKSLISVVTESAHAVAERALRLLADAGEARDPEQLLAESLDTMVRLAGAAGGIVRVVASDGEHMRLVAAVGLPDDVIERERLVSLDCGVCGAAVSGDAVRQGFELHDCAVRSGSPHFDSYRAISVVPLRHVGKVLGAYTLYFSERREMPEDVALLFRSITEHLGLALENARLLRENMRMTLMNERQLMANEVHDSLAQTMAYMNLRLTMMIEAMQREEKPQALKFASDVQIALEGAYADLRELLSQFRSRMDPLGLVHAFGELAANFHDRTGVTLEIQNRIADLDLTVDEEVQVFHIIQEALANVVRHSGAKSARLTMEKRDGSYEFSIEDDGLGFFTMGRKLGGTGDDSHLRHHLGINIMRERAERINGRLEIANLPQGGARVRLVLPGGARGTPT